MFDSLYSFLLALQQTRSDNIWQTFKLSICPSYTNWRYLPQLWLLESEWGSTILYQLPPFTTESECVSAILYQFPPFTTESEWVGAILYQWPPENLNEPVQS